MAKYKTLKELQAAFAVGALRDAEDAVLWLDNDQTTIYVDNERVFEMHPEDLLEQALTLLGIPWEHV
jgi:hypothetical protein